LFRGGLSASVAEASIKPDQASCANIMIVFREVVVTSNALKFRQPKRFVRNRWFYQTVKYKTISRVLFYIYGMDIFT